MAEAERSQGCSRCLDEKTNPHSREKSVGYRHDAPRKTPSEDVRGIQSSRSRTTRQVSRTLGKARVRMLGRMGWPQQEPTLSDTPSKRVPLLRLSIRTKRVQLLKRKIDL